MDMQNGGPATENYMEMWKLIKGYKCFYKISNGYLNEK